jgi:hypothetical protein
MPLAERRRTRQRRVRRKSAGAAPISAVALRHVQGGCNSIGDLVRPGVGCGVCHHRKLSRCHEERDVRATSGGLRIVTKKVKVNQKKASTMMRITLQPHDRTHLQSAPQLVTRGHVERPICISSLRHKSGVVLPHRKRHRSGSRRRCAACARWLLEVF